MSLFRWPVLRWGGGIGGAPPPPPPPPAAVYTTSLPLHPDAGVDPAIPADLHVAGITKALAGSFPDGRYRATVLNTSGNVVRRLFFDIIGHAQIHADDQPRLVPTTLAELLQDVRQLLVDTTGLDDNQVMIALNPKPVPLPQGPVLYVRPSNFQADSNLADGLGRIWPVFHGAITVRVAEQMVRDTWQEDPYRMTGFGIDLPRLVPLVQARLNQYFPLDAAGNYLTVEPLRSIGPPEPAPDHAPGWAAFDLSFETSYLEDHAGAAG